VALTAGSDIFAGNLSSGGDVFVDTGGSIAVGNITGSSVDLDAGGGITMGNVHAGSLDFSAGGSVSGGDIVASANVGGDAEGAVHFGDITVTSVAEGLEDNDFSIGIFSATSIEVGDVSSPGRVGFATHGNLTTGNVSAGSTFLALVGGDLLTGAITTAADGRVYFGNSSMFVAAGGTDDFDADAVLSGNPVTTGGSITVDGPVTTGRMQAAAGASMTLGDVTANTSVDVRAGSLASFLGTVSAPTITVTSGDIDIADGASLGVHGVTQLLTLNATNDEIVIGEGDSGSDGYYLNEEGHIRSDALVFNAIGSGETGGPDINIFDTHIEGSQTDGGGFGNIIVNTDGSIIVRGHVDFVNAGSEDSLALNAGEKIEVITDSGSISMTDSEGDLSGSLSLTAHDIWVADQALIDQLEEDPDFDALDAALAINNGPVNPDGYVRAGSIEATMLGSSLLVQNSGTADDFAGLTAGGGGLTIVNQGNDPAKVIVFGRQVNPDGTIVKNEAFAALVHVDGETTSDSQVNSCAIGAGSCGDSGPVEPEIPTEVVASDAVMGPLVSSESTEQSDDSADDEDEGSAEGDSSVDASAHLINTSPLQTNEIIDEPITSGNDGPGGPN
jgi:hypothetical protein